MTVMRSRTAGTAALVLLVAAWAVYPAWASGAEQPLTVKGSGMVDVSYWRQKNSLTAHIVSVFFYW